MKKLSIVIPAHNEEGNLSSIAKEIIKNIPSKYDYEIIFIDDGSKDKTLNEIKKLSKNKKIKGISLYKNFGQQAALFAGIKHANADIIISMDADGQHPPQLIPKMVSLWEKGHDVVILQKSEDKQMSLFMKLNRKIAYPIWSFLSDGIIIPKTSDFRLIDKNIAQTIKDSNESTVLVRGFVTSNANNIAFLEYKVRKRRKGKSSYNFKKLFLLFVDGILLYSTKPLRIASILGLIIAVATGLFLSFDIIHALFLGERIVKGYVTLVLLSLILNGFIIFYLGILGEYIGIIFKEVKNRPLFLIKEKINLK